MRLRVCGTGLALGLAAGLLVVVTASAASATINVAPRSVAVGGTVTVSGSILIIHNGIPICRTVTLVSDAFFNPKTGRNTVDAGVAADGRFSTRVRILPDVAPGNYAVIIAACLPASNLAQTTLTVTPGLPATGNGSSQRARTGDMPVPVPPIVMVVVAAAGLVVVGMWACRQRSA